MAEPGVSLLGIADAALRFGVVAFYFAVVLGIGVVAFRRTEATAEDYFLGGRTAKTVVLFMALFGTNITPFVLMGIPGLAYHAGVGVFGYNAAIIVLGIPLTFYAIGYPAWIAAKELGAVTPAELYARRFESPWLGRLMFAVFFVYTVPYMATAVSGVGLAVDILSDHALSFELAAAGILVITLAYTSVGGMKATMWTNVLQGAVFMGFTLLAFFWIASDHGGLVNLMGRVQAEHPELLVTPDRAPFTAGQWSSWALAIALTVIAFPHMLVRIFAAKDVSALKNACRYYPLAMVLLWIPVTLFGVWGVVEFPGLEGKASDRVFPMLVAAHMGPALQGLALAGILAAVMSTLDAQMLTLSSMLTRDVLPQRQGGERREILWGRVFLLVLAALTFALVLSRPASIFDLAKLSFSGYVTLVPTLFLGLRWRGFTVQGAFGSILAGNAVLVAGTLELVPTFGLLPVAWGLIAAIVAALVISKLGPQRRIETGERVLDRVEHALSGG